LARSKVVLPAEGETHRAEQRKVILGPVMRALAIETSAEVASLALFEDGRVVASLEHHEAERHAERLFGLLEQLFRSAPFPKESLDCLLLGIGPGSFTGVRVGLSLGQGLAVGWGLPMFGVTSLRSMAAEAMNGGKRILCPLLDARKGDVFAAAYTECGAELMAPFVLPGASVQEFFDSRLEGSEPVFLGSVTSTLPLRSPVLSGSPFDRPRAASFWRAVWPQGEATLSGASNRSPEPEYVREPNLLVPKLLASPFQTL